MEDKIKQKKVSIIIWKRTFESFPSRKIKELQKTEKVEYWNSASAMSEYDKTAKPLAYKMCHGKKGDGMGKLRKTLKNKQIWDIFKYIRESWVK